jgi:hypothetical protein
VPTLRRRKGGSPGRLTSQLLLFRAHRPGTSSNKFRHPADAGPLPAQSIAQTPFLLFPPARTHPAGCIRRRSAKNAPPATLFGPQCILTSQVGQKTRTCDVSLPSCAGGQGKWHKNFETPVLPSNGVSHSNLKT